MPKKTYHVLFLIGLPDSAQVSVAGYNPQGELLYMWDGNADFHAHISGEKFIPTMIQITGSDEPKRTFPKPDIIVNCINDADISSKSLQKAEKAVSLLRSQMPDVALFNPPAMIANTQRDAIYRLYNQLPGITIPKTARITSQSPEAVFEDVKSAGIGVPFLIRPCGAHQSQGLQKIDGVDAIDKLEKYPLDGRAYYVTDYADYQSPDGLYRKCRLVMIGDKLLPRHYMTGEDWLVHGDLHQDYMATNAAAKREEAYFMQNYKKMISKEALKSVRHIYERSGLDYLGFDCAIMADKSLLVFEINAAQNSFLTLNFESFPYMKKVRDDLIQALNDAVIKKISRKHS